MLASATATPNNAPKFLQVQELEERIASLEQKLKLFESSFKIPVAIQDRAKQLD